MELLDELDDDDAPEDVPSFEDLYAKQAEPGEFRGIGFFDSIRGARDQRDCGGLHQEDRGAQRCGGGRCATLPSGFELELWRGGKEEAREVDEGAICQTCAGQ